MSPAHLFGCEAIDLVLADDRGFRIFTRRRHEIRLRPDRRQRCSLRARSKRGRAGHKSKGEFQKVTAFHDISLSRVVNDGDEFRRDQMNGR